MAELVEELSRDAGATPQALGVGCPGLVDAQSGKALSLPNFPDDWQGVSLTDELASKLEIPVHVLNDVRMATLGELDYGLGSLRQNPTFVLLALGTGIGGGVVVDGKLRLGPTGSAGELGHMVIAAAGGPPCGCGASGCLESLASAPALLGEATRLLKANQTPKLAEILVEAQGSLSVELVAAAARAGDRALAAANRPPSRASRHRHRQHAGDSATRARCACRWSGSDGRSAARAREAPGRSALAFCSGRAHGDRAVEAGVSDWSARRHRFGETRWLLRAVFWACLSMAHFVQDPNE